MTMVERKLPATSRIMAYGEYQLSAYKGMDFEWNVGDLAEYAKSLSVKIFGLSREETAREVAANMRNGGSIVLATLTATEEVVGYTTSRVLEPVIDGNPIRVHFTTTASVLPEHEIKGVGTAMKQFSYSTSGSPDILGGRTRKPPVVRTYYRSNLVEEGKLYPLDKLYETSRNMWSVLRYVASQLWPRLEVNDKTGLIEGVYKDELDTYDYERASPEVRAIDAKMREFGASPDTNNAIVLLGVRRGWTRFRE